MSMPRLLDLFCCEGGASVGYHRAGFDVLGVDIKPKRRYPFLIYTYDALDFLRDHGRRYDAALPAIREAIAQEIEALDPRFIIGPLDAARIVRGGAA